MLAILFAGRVTMVGCGDPLYLPIRPRRRSRRVVFPTNENGIDGSRRLSDVRRFPFDVPTDEPRDGDYPGETTREATFTLDARP